MTRESIHPRHPELVALVQGARNSARRAAFFAAQAALRSTPVPDKPVPEALEAIERSDIGAAVRLRPDLERLAQALDKVYWDLSDAEPGPAMMQAFSRARAVSALASAVGVNPVEAALDAIYEAQVSFPDREVDGFLESVKALLRQLQVQK